MATRGGLRWPRLLAPVTIGLVAASCSSSPTTKPVAADRTTATTPTTATATNATATTNTTAPRATTTSTTAAQPVPVDLGGGWMAAGWQPAGRPVAGGPAVEATLLSRPGRQPVGLARMDTSRLRVVMYATGSVPADLLPGLVATFNGGFKANQARGGWYHNGAAAAPLRDGAASLVIRADGSATVGQWGRDVQLGPDVVAVRQNLDLLVDSGQPAATVNGGPASLQATWGYTLKGPIETWRSAVAVDGAGRLLYAGGPALDPAALASAMIAAGATRAMELDINPAWVNFDTFVDGPGGVVGTKLLPGMNYPANHYLTSSGGRDFFAVFARDR